MISNATVSAASTPMFHISASASWATTASMTSFPTHTMPTGSAASMNDVTSTMVKKSGWACHAVAHAQR